MQKQKNIIASSFELLRDKICTAFEDKEKDFAFDKIGDKVLLNVRARKEKEVGKFIHGNVFEKEGVNVHRTWKHSTVHALAPRTSRSFNTRYIETTKS